MNAPTTLAEIAAVAKPGQHAGEQGKETPHESALLHVTGEAVYTDDIPELRGTLYAALITSPVAHGELVGEGIDRAAILAMHGVVAVYTAKDIPGENNCGPIIHDDPFLADGTVLYLGQPVAVVVARGATQAQQAAQVVELDIEALPPVQGDPGQLRQVLVNLVENAVYAASPIGTVAVRGRRADGAVLLDVEDTGPGVDAATRRRLFEPLITTKERGIGLGLALVKRIAERHGGGVEYSDREGGGARFTVRLPA